jgi:hypothetical protein
MPLPLKPRFRRFVFELDRRESGPSPRVAPVVVVVAVPLRPPHRARG